MWTAVFLISNLNLQGQVKINSYFEIKQSFNFWSWAKCRKCKCLKEQERRLSGSVMLPMYLSPVCPMFSLEYILRLIRDVILKESNLANHGLDISLLRQKF